MILDLGISCLIGTSFLACSSKALSMYAEPTANPNVLATLLTHIRHLG